MTITDEVNDFYYHMALYELQLMNDGDFYNGLSYNSLLYLNVISQFENCTASKIADALHVTKSAVTIKLNELARQGAVVRVQSEHDRRVFYVRLSPRMEQAFGLYDEVFGKIEAKLRERYTAEQLGLFTEILHTISSYEWRKIQHE